jgi:hypothetical protein
MSIVPQALEQYKIVLYCIVFPPNNNAIYCWINLLFPWVTHAAIVTLSQLTGFLYPFRENKFDVSVDAICFIIFIR